MDTKNALTQITQDLRNNNFHISAHAFERMSQRNLTSVDILCLIKKLSDPIWNEPNESWNFLGESFSGEIFTIACAYENDGTLIVTVFWE